MHLLINKKHSNALKTKLHLSLHNNTYLWTVPCFFVITTVVLDNFKDDETETDDDSGRGVVVVTGGDDDDEDGDDDELKDPQGELLHSIVYSGGAEGEIFLHGVFLFLFNIRRRTLICKYSVGY